MKKFLITVAGTFVGGYVAIWLYDLKHERQVDRDHKYDRYAKVEVNRRSSDQIWEELKRRR